MVRVNVEYSFAFLLLLSLFFFFFNDTATTEIYTLSLHDALPISSVQPVIRIPHRDASNHYGGRVAFEDRKSTRLNSSHLVISYAVFCLKKKKKYTFLTRLTHCIAPVRFGCRLSSADRTLCTMTAL